VAPFPPEGTFLTRYICVPGCRGRAAGPSRQQAHPACRAAPPAGPNRQQGPPQDPTKVDIWGTVRCCLDPPYRLIPRGWEPPAMLVLLPFFAGLEAVSGLRGFVKFVRRTENKFVVIEKPT